MTSDIALASLRSAAAMVAALPSVRVRVRVDGRTLVEAARPPFPALMPHPVVPWCRFRNAVIDAHEQRLAGRHVSLLGVDSASETSIAYGVRPGEICRPGGLVRATLGNRWIHAVAVALPANALRSATTDWIPADDLLVRIAAHEDEALGVSILHVATDAGDHRHSAAAFDGLITALGRVAADELEAHLAPSAVWQVTPDPGLS